jgi:hypothetical protein
MDSLETQVRHAPSPDEQRANAWSADGQRAALRTFQRHGFLEIPDAIPKELAEALAQAYEAHYQTSEHVLAKSALRVGDGRYQETVALEPPFDDPRVYANSFALPMLDGVLGGQAVIVSAGVVSALPGAADQHVHRDYPDLFLEMPMSHMLPRFAVMMMVPLVDLDPDTVGTTGVWLGSHREDPARAPERSSYASAFLPSPRRGSIYLMDYRLMHGGTANRSDHERPVLYLLFGRPWFLDVVHYARQERIRISEEALARVPVSHRRLFSHVRPDWAPWAVSSRGGTDA